MRAFPENAVVLSFEGPDPYSMVGGLGTRVNELSGALAAAGVRTTLIFVGDPERPPVESPAPNLEYRRWCQWISKYHPGNVYDGEHGKSSDYRVSVPPFVLDSIVAPAAQRDESVLVIGEDWQIAPAVIELARMLHVAGLRERVMLTWNANNTYGFESIDWRALRQTATITTVSRYMKFELRARGVEALVIPNGIPERLIGGPPPDLVQAASEAIKARPLFVKVGRYDEDKRWMQAIDAFARLRRLHSQATLLVRGGREPYGQTIFARARALGLDVEDVAVSSRDSQALLEALSATSASIVNIRTFVPEELLFALYQLADAVLANSGKEPFGLVGLEVMAAGGLAVTGSTGEDYAQPFENAIVCDTSDGRELAAYLEALLSDASLARSIRSAGEAVAERCTWPIVLDILARKLSF
jgi:glycosyltransferase involved in cell wall biosynthesis